MLIDKKKEQRKIARSFALYNLGVFFCWSAFYAITNIQSSINIEDGLGTTTLAAMFVTSVLCGIFFASAAIRKFGVKTCMVVADAAMFPYILANIYPTYYTLLPAGILMFILQCPFWPSMILTNVSFASQFSGVSKKTKDVHIIYFSGYFFAIFQVSQVFGSLVAYIILYGFDRIPLPEIEVPTNCTESSNTTCQITVPEYPYCGVNDCQNATIISESIEKYKPVNRTSLYVLIGVAIFLEFLSVLIHGFFLPSDDTFEKKRKEYATAVFEQNHDFAETTSLPGDDIESRELCESGKSTDSANVEPNENSKLLNGSWKITLDAAKSLFKHSINIRVLLLAPMTLYNGLAMSFVATELTRAFTSCILGVQWVGICGAIFGLVDAILSRAVGNFGRKIGRIQVFVIAVVLECGNYLYCMLWSPGPNILLSVIALFFGFGFTDGIIQIIVNVTHIDFFPDNRDVALTVWNVLVEIGICLGFILSNVFCVRTRVYFNMTFLALGFIGMVTADVYHRKIAKKAKLEENTQRDQTADT